MEAESPKKQYQKRHAALKNERSTWDAHWKELSDYIQPRFSRFYASERNQGMKKHQHIINSTAGDAADVSAAGMMAGITSPARPWFNFTTQDRALAELGPVKEHLYRCQEVVQHALHKSNAYNSFHSLYKDLGTPGTSALFVEEDVESVLRCYVLPIGTYCLANSARQRVDTIYRELSMTVAQLVEKFGLDKCSSTVRSAYERGTYDQWIEVLHVIEPNRSRQLNKLGPKGMAWKSCWFEKASGDDSGFLLESGFHEFPVMAPRWDVTGEDVYGSSPGMDALGDVKALQLLERRAMQAFDKVVNPPMTGPSDLQDHQFSLLPGKLTRVSGMGGAQSFQPAMTIQAAALNAFTEKIREHERRINRKYRADLWLAISQSDGRMTATEVAERHEEKMLQLGPVMERLDDEFLNPFFERVWAILERRGMFPVPPKELQGQEIKIEYTSVMAQAQRAIGISSIEKLVGFVGNLAGVHQQVLDKVDFDQAVDEYGSRLSAPPSLIRPDDKVAAMRAARAKAESEMQQAQQAMEGVQAAKVLSETDTTSPSALNDLLGMASAGTA